MSGVGKTGKTWKHVTEEEVFQWRRLITEESLSLRAVGRLTGRDHQVIARHVSERPRRGARKDPEQIRDARRRWRRSLDGIIYYMLHQARRRSRRKGLAFDLTHQDIMSLYQSQEGKCSLTGINFSLDSHATSRSNPFCPSIDRIDSGKGYTIDNIRLVIWAINWAIGEWGEDCYREVAEAYLAQRHR
jgi:hypothetical protein